MNNVFRLIFSTDFVYAIFRGMTPLLFAGMGAVLSDVAGVPNIALEGLMLIAAFIRYVFQLSDAECSYGTSGSHLCCGFFRRCGWLSYHSTIKPASFWEALPLIRLQVVARYSSCIWQQETKGTSISLASKSLPVVTIPLINRIPVLGAILSGHNILTYISILAVVFTFYLLQRTAFGYHLRAVGEKKEAAESVGISVEKTQAAALLLSGLMCGFGGAFMSMGYVSWFSRDMLASRGWIALAAEAMGMQTPIGTALTCGLFGVADAFSNAVATLGFPSDLVTTIPYVVTLIGLTVFSIRIMKKRSRT